MEGGISCWVTRADALEGLTKVGDVLAGVALAREVRLREGRLRKDA
jgi:hypothetical protein